MQWAHQKQLAEKQWAQRNHRQLLQKMQWAYVMMSDAARREATGPNEAIGSSLQENRMGPYESIGNCCRKCSGPMLWRWMQLAEKQLAQTKPSPAAAANQIGRS